MAGVVIALGGHLLTLLAVLVGVGAADSDVITAGIWVGLAGQLVLFLGCLIAGVILTVRQDGGIGIGLLIGWAVGVLIIPVLGFGLCVAALASLSETA